jgi:hypothetical protein
MAIPTGRPRGQQEVPLWMYNIAKDVIEDPSYAQLPVDVIRQEIRERLSERPDWPSKLHLISLQFVTNLRSSLTHPNFCRRPRQCYRVDDDTSSSEVEEVDDSASAVSMTSFHAPQETTTSNELGAAAGSSPHAVHIPTFVTSPGSEGETRRFEFLHVFCQFLEVQLDHLKLLSESRKHQKAPKKAPKKGRKMLKKGGKPLKKYRTRLREGIEITDAGNDNEPKLQPTNAVLRTRRGQAHKPDDDLDSLFGSDGEEEHENYAPEDS